MKNALLIGFTIPSAFSWFCYFELFRGNYEHNRLVFPYTGSGILVDGVIVATEYMIENIFGHDRRAALEEFGKNVVANCSSTVTTLMVFFLCLGQE